MGICGVSLGVNTLALFNDPTQSLCPFPVPIPTHNPEQSALKSRQPATRKRLIKAQNTFRYNFVSHVSHRGIYLYTYMYVYIYEYISVYRYVCVWEAIDSFENLKLETL